MNTDFAPVGPAVFMDPGLRRDDGWSTGMGVGPVELVIPDLIRDP
jgi:hypothetical protein